MEIRNLTILLLIFSCDEPNSNTTSLGSDGTAIQDTIIIQQDTTIINIIYDTTIIVMDTIIYNYPPSIVITSPISQSLDSTTVIRAEAIDDTGISNVKFLIGGVNADGSMLLVLQILSNHMNMNGIFVAILMDFILF